MRVLVVDPRGDTRSALAALIRSADVDVTVTDSGREALDLLVVHDHALAVIGMTMPELDGYQLAERIRGMPSGRAMSILFVTETREPLRAFEGSDAGPVDLLLTPLDPQLVEHKVATTIELVQHKRRLAEQVAQIERMSMQLHAINHDLRSPLHAISIGVSLLADDLQAPRQKDVVRRIENAIERMTASLDQLHDPAHAAIVIKPSPRERREVGQGHPAAGPLPDAEP